MHLQRTVLLLATALLAAVPIVIWAQPAPAQYQPREDVYRPPAPRENIHPASPKSPPGQDYYPPGTSKSGPGQPYSGGPPPSGGSDDRDRDSTYSSNEILDTGHRFFGAVTQGLANVVEFAFQKQGRPNGYILGQDAGGAIVAGLRYGEGTLYTKDAGNHRVYWQGPSIGWDMGGDGSKVMVLVYNLRDPEDIYRRFAGVDGSAYMVGGVGLTFQQNGGVVTAPIRTGVGLRLGANVGYLKYTRAPTWNPF